MRRSVQLLILAFAVIAIILLVWLSTQKDSPFYKPIESYELVLPTKQVTHEQIDATIKPYLGTSFWDIPLNKIQADLTRLDWVQSVQVKRKWPNLLYISIKEQLPVTRWGEAGLVNRSGEVFFPESIAGYTNLVQLDGDLADSERVLRHFLTLQREFANLDMVIKSLKLSADDVWGIAFLDGTTVVLDSLNYEHKLQRFIKAYPQLDSEVRNSARNYDLRYSNGFIIAKK
ncbi:MAG: cell division protein FtsQ/DivIB [Thiomicrorhabdus sp.]|nr:cell division protein FtsQ/DivIB [Thiomicrorhabdus sp.]